MHAGECDCYGNGTGHGSDGCDWKGASICARRLAGRPGPRRRAWSHGNASPCLISFMRTFMMARRSEEHTSELQSLMRISYAVFCLKKKNTTEQLDTALYQRAQR